MNVMQKRDPLYLAALFSLALLVAGTLLYPDTLVSAGWHFGSIRISPMGILFILALPATGWYCWTRRAGMNWGLLDLLLLLTLLFVGIRGLAAVNNGNELGLVVAMVGYVSLLYYGTAQVGQHEGALKVLFLVLVFVAAIVAAYAMVEFALGRNILFEGIIKKDMIPPAQPAYHRSGSTLGHPGPLGAFMVQVMPYILFFFIRAAGKTKKIAWGSLIVLCSLALLTTYSKGAWIAAAVLVFSGVSWMVWRRPVAIRAGIMLLLVTMVAIGAFTVAFYDTVHAGTLSKTRTSESFSPRIYMWSRVPETFLANPVVGAGLWQGNAEIFIVNPAPMTANRPTSIDSLYLTALVEEGLAGILLIGATLALMGRQAWNLLKDGGPFAVWGLPVAASMALILINGFSSNTLMLWPTMVVFWLSAGILRSLVERDRRQEEATS